MNQSQNDCPQDMGSINLQEQLDPAANLKVQLLEKQIQELQDYTEDLTFKAQRHEEAAASLRSQNAFLVKKCSDLQRQLIECLSTVDVRDIQCNDAESKLKRVRLALEEKEFALLNMSSHLSAALWKIGENEREMEKVESEMANVNRKFMKVSCNQRELREDVAFYKNIVKARDRKIEKLLEDRLRVSTCLEAQKQNRWKDRQTCSCRNAVNGALQKEISDNECEELMKNISVGDDILTERMRMLKSDNARLATQVSSLNGQLDNRGAIDILRMNQILEKIGNVEDDMISFLTQLEADQYPAPNKTTTHDENNRPFAGKNSGLMRDLAKMKGEVVTLRRANFYLEKVIKIQLSSRGTIFKNADCRQSDLEEKILRGKFDGRVIPGEGSNQIFEENVKTLSASQLSEPASESLDNLVKNALPCEETIQDFLDMIDFLCVSQSFCNAYEELFRLSVLLQVCLLKMKAMMPEEKHLPIMSGLKGVLLKIRSTISSYQSGNFKETEVEETVKVPMWMYYGAPEGEPSTFVTSATGLRTQSSTRFMSKEVLAATETEARMGQRRHQIQHFHKSHVRLRNGDSSWPSNAPREDNRVIQKLYSGGQHQVCTDLVVNLQRNLRASERNNVKMQEKLCAKTKEMEKLQQEVSNLRLSLEAANDTLDNKKIALGRSEAIWQMLRVSEASLEQRLEVEQRQHEDCRQELDKVAAALEEMRIRCEKKVSRDDLDSKEDSACTWLPSPAPAPAPAPIANRAELANLLKHAKDRNRDIIRIMDDYVSLMMNDMNLLQRHFGEKQHDPPGSM